MTVFLPFTSWGGKPNKEWALFLWELETMKGQSESKCQITWREKHNVRGWGGETRPRLGGVQPADFWESKIPQKHAPEGERLCNLSMHVIPSKTDHSRGVYSHDFRPVSENFIFRDWPQCPSHVNRVSQALLEYPMKFDTKRLLWWSTRITGAVCETLFSKGTLIGVGN